MSLSNLLIIFSSSFMALFPVINPLGNGFVVNGFFTDLDPQQRKAAIQKLTLNFIMIGVGTLVIGHLFLLIFGLQQFAFNTGRRHQSKDNRYTARPDTDRKRDGIKYLLLDVFPSEAVYILTGFFFIRRTRIAQQLHCRFTNQHSTSQLNNRNSQTENQ